MKVIVLPGFLQNGARLRKRAVEIEKMLNSHGLEVDYVDPPKKLEMDQVGYKLGPTEEEAQAKWKSVVNRDFNRCWWDYQGNGVYSGFDDSFKWLIDYLEKNGPYVGILGFSQGGSMTAIITNSITRCSTHPAFKFSICFSGFPFHEPRDRNKKTRTDVRSLKTVAEYMHHSKIMEAYAGYYVAPENSSTKIIVVYGDHDPVVTPIRSQYLAHTLHASEIEFEGGHDVPHDKETIKKIEAQLQSVFTKL